MIPKNFTVADIDELIEVQKKIFSGPFPFTIVSENVKKHLSKTAWGNSNEVIQDLKEITKAENLEDIGKILGEWKTEISKEPVEQTVIAKDQLEVLKEGLEERERQSRESEKASQEYVEKLEERAKKIYLQSKKELPETSLDGNDRVVLENLAKSASGDPKTFVNDLSQTINQKTGVDVESSQLAALDLYERITTGTQSTPPEIFLSTASHFDSEEIREASLVFGKLAEENNNDLREILTPLLGKNLSETFYPSSPREFEVTSERTNKTLFEVDPNQLIKDYKEVNPFNVLDKFKEAGRDHIKSIILQKIEGLPAQSAIKGIFSKAQSSMFFNRTLPFLGLSAPAEVVATNFVGKSIQFLFPKFAPVIADFGAKLGINIGIKTVAPAVLTTTGSTAVKAVGGTLGKAAVGILAKVGITIPAQFIPGLNFVMLGVTLLSLLKDLGKLIKELGPKIKRWLSDNAPVLIGIGAVGLLLGNPLIAGLGIISISAGLLSGASLAKMGAKTAFFFGRIGSSLAITIATPVIVAIVVFPILVAVILFIINSGAYVVPSQVGFGTYSGECSNEGLEIASRAQSINNNLQRGFNGFFNKSPEYPELWNQELFLINPNPENQQDVIDADDMFWCNYLATKSFSVVKEGFPFHLSSMVNYFKSQDKWIDAKAVTIDAVCPGHAIYFSIPANSGKIAHVAVVSKVSPDGITTAESNAPYKTMFYPVDESGYFQIIGSGSGTIEIVGFGAP